MLLGTCNMDAMCHDSEGMVASCRYLYVEWEDPAFGPRAAAVHKRLQEGLTSSEEASHSMAAISAQMGLVAQLRHIANELKVIYQSPSTTANITMITIRWCPMVGGWSCSCWLLFLSKPHNPQSRIFIQSEVPGAVPLTT